MIIRSQDKKLIVNFDNVSEVCICDNSIGMGATAGGVNFIGTYSTEEKAIKVLDMITEAYQKETYGKFEYNADVVYCVPRNTVFQMPQDSEV